MFCGQCGAQQASGRRFCPNCGAAAEDQGVQASAGTHPAATYAASPSVAVAAPAPTPPGDSPRPSGGSGLGKVGALVGVALLAVTAAAAGYVVGQSGKDSSDSPLSLAALTSGSWNCTDADGNPYDIRLSGAPGEKSAAVVGSDGSSTTSVRAEQSGDADILVLANGLLNAMGEQGSVALVEEGNSPLTLSWAVAADRVRLSYSDEYSSSEVTCSIQP